MNYNEQITSASRQINDTTKIGIGIICFAVPPILILASLLVFTSKFKLHGKLADEVHDFIVKKRAEEQGE